MADEEKKDQDGAGGLADAQTDTSDNNDDANQDFDIAAFMSEESDDDGGEAGSGTDNNNSSDTGDDSGENNDDSGDDDNDTSFSWDLTDSGDDNDDSDSNDDSGSNNDNDSTDDSDSGDNQNQNDTDNSDDDNSSDNDSNNTPTIDASVLKQFHDAGIPGNTLEEVLANAKGVVQEKQIYENAALTNDNIKAWRNFLSLDDKALVLKDYEVQNVPEDKRNELVANLEKNNMLGVKAQDIRAAIRGSISRETNAIKKRNSQDEAKRSQEVAKIRQELQNHIDGQETMFGFRMAKKAEDLPKVREDHYKYISEGRFYTEVFSSPESVTEAAWLWKHRKTILKAFENKGGQAGKQEILNDLENPSKDTHVDFSDHSDKSKEFDKDAFMNVDSL